MPGGNARAAAQAIQHVWITDDVLARAFHRFARISHAHRRHGSNVPGPLEARRRQAKRKMGMEAAARNNMPPTDFGSLFGLGSARPPPDFERGWRWEAPWIGPSGTVTAKQRTDYDQLDVESDQPPPAKRFTKYKPLGYNKDRVFEDFLTIPADPTETSISAFQVLLEPMKDKTLLEANDMHPIIAFLDSAANEPDAQLTLRLVQWLADRALASNEVWRIIAQSTLTRAHNLDIRLDEVTSIFMHLLYHQEKGQEVLQFFARLPIAAHDVYPKLTERILRTSHDKNERIAKVGVWLNRVHPPRHSGQPHDSWVQVYELLAQHFQPSEFAEHFGAIPRKRFAWALLQNWAPTYLGRKTASVTKGATEELESKHDKFALATIPQGRHKHYAPFDESMTSVDWKSIQEQFNRRDRKGSSFILNTLISLLKSNRIPYQHLQAEILAVYIATQPATVTKNLVLSLIHRRERSNPGISTELATKLVQHFLATGHPSYALFIFLSVPSVPLSACYDLPLKLIEAGRTHADKVIQILLRSTPGESVPEIFRTLPRNDIPSTHIDVVHKCAYAWACSPHVNARTAFRRVWECYRFLKDRNCPISTLMSRAMVKAGISRAIKQNGRLSQVQAKYVIGLVERIEGHATAVELDRLVYDYWTRVKDVRIYRPGVQQDQEGKYWIFNRMIWKADASKNRPPPGARKNASHRDATSSTPSPELDGAVAELSKLLDEEVAGLLDAGAHQPAPTESDPTTFLPFGASTHLPAESPLVSETNEGFSISAPLDLKTSPLVRAYHSPLSRRDRFEAVQLRSRGSSKDGGDGEQELRYWRPENVRQMWLQERGNEWDNFQLDWRAGSRNGRDGTISKIVVDRREEPLIKRLEEFCTPVDGGGKGSG